MPISKPLYQAAMYLKSGHPAYRRPWQQFVGSLPTENDDTAMIAATAGITTAEVTRAIIRSLNGLDPHANSVPRRTRPAL